MCTSFAICDFLGLENMIIMIKLKTILSIDQLESGYLVLRLSMESLATSLYYFYIEEYFYITILLVFCGYNKVKVHNIKG